MPQSKLQIIIFQKFLFLPNWTGPVASTNFNSRDRIFQAIIFELEVRIYTECSPSNMTNSQLDP